MEKTDVNSISKGIKQTNPVESLNIIADVAGRFDELQGLLKIMPEGEILLVGDLHDRGSQSKEVIQWARKNNIMTLNSNHGDMFVDFMEGTGLYQEGIFMYNGGEATLMSYGLDLIDVVYGGVNDETVRQIALEHVDIEDIEWLKNLPYYYMQDGLFVSHAPRATVGKLEDLCVRGPMERSLLWNRWDIGPIDGVFQVYGHNSKHGWDFDQKGNKYGVCIDNCHGGELMGIHWPTKELYRVDYNGVKKL